MQTTSSLRYSMGAICVGTAGCQSSERLEMGEAEHSGSLDV